jgi:hypothetical protein
MNTLNSNRSVDLNEDETAALFLLNQTMEFAYPAALRAAAVVGVADHLADGPKSVDELAHSTDTDKMKLYRVLRLLASRGVFHEIAPEQFELTTPARLLCKDASLSMRSAVLMITDETFWRPAGEISDIMRSADTNPAFRRIFGMTFFEHWARETERADDFHAGMSSMSEVENRFLVRNYAFPKGATVVDVAGGFGGLLLRVLQANQTLHGILYDRPHVLARSRLIELEDSNRYNLVSGDFFESCPCGDVYLIKYIMHDWDDEHAIRILHNCRRAMKPGGKVLVLDPIIPPGNAPDTSKIMDLHVMGIYDGGRERTEAELSRLMTEAGLQLTRVIDTGCHVSIIESVAKQS